MKHFHSESLSSLFEALAAAQSVIDNVTHDREVEVPIRDKNNPGQFKGKYRFRYSTLAGIMNVIRPPLTENGIFFTQYIREGEMITRLFHKSGEWMEAGVIPMPDIKGSPQDIGSITSYFRRYSLSAALGLASEEDNDGEQGDREVSFRARGTPKARDDQEQSKVEEPPMGWGDWARGLLDAVKSRTTPEELQTLQQTNWPYIDRLRHVDKTMFDDLSNAFGAKRAALNPKEAF